MTIKRLTPENYTPELKTQVTTLFNQLNPSIAQRPLEQLLTEGDRLVFLICEVDGKLAGMASMATYKVISGHKGMVEDVVVDATYRGQGIGRALMEQLLEEGHKLKLSEMLLFTGHHRTAAIKLYQSLGFALKQSGLYTLQISSRPVV